MKKAIIKIELEIEYFDEIENEDIIDEVENLYQLPSGYKENSFEWVGIQVSDDEFIPFNKFPQREK